MDRIVQLVSERNHYLENFITLNKKELEKFRQNDFEDVEKFYETRDRILKLLGDIEDLISVELESPGVAKILSDNDKKVIRSQIRRKEELTQTIIEQDIELIAMLDKEKKKIYSEVQSIKKGRKVIGAYKSKTSPNP